VVAGIRTPTDLKVRACMHERMRARQKKKKSKNKRKGGWDVVLHAHVIHLTPRATQGLRATNSKLYDELMGVHDLLERHYRDMQVRG
jgi:hypothetical protein